MLIKSRPLQCTLNPKPYPWPPKTHLFKKLYIETIIRNTKKIWARRLELPGCCVYVVGSPRPRTVGALIIRIGFYWGFVIIIVV